LYFDCAINEKSLPSVMMILGGRNDLIQNVAIMPNTIPFESMPTNKPMRQDGNVKKLLIDSVFDGRLK